MGPLFEVYQQVANHSRVFIEDSFFTDFFTNDLVCHSHFSEEAKKMVKSKQSLYNSPVAMLLSYSTPKEIVHIFNYRMHNMIEFDIVNAILTHITDGLMEQINLERNIKGYQCSGTRKGIIFEFPSKGWDPLPIHFYLRFTFICISIMIVALIILMIEIKPKAAFFTHKKKSVITAGATKAICLGPLFHTRKSSDKQAFKHIPSSRQTMTKLIEVVNE